MIENEKARKAKNKLIMASPGEPKTILEGAK